MMEPNGTPQGTGAETGSGNVSIDNVLTALRAAEPAPGLEDRLLRRLIAHPVASRPVWRLWAAPVALATCAAMIFLLSSFRTNRQRQTTAHIASSSSANPPSSQPERTSSFPPGRSGLIVSRSGETRISNNELDARAGTALAAEVDHRPSRKPGLQPLRSARTGTIQTASERIRHDAVCPTSGLSDVGCPQSYPAPELPLTEQERLLLKIAHRNDPVQIAALDPVARELELAREHAETRRFFTPPPRPPEIQHDIDEAMKSQTIITPATDRTLP